LANSLSDLLSGCGQDLLFPNPDGEPYNPEEITKKFLKPILTELGINENRKALHAVEQLWVTLTPQVLTTESWPTL